MVDLTRDQDGCLHARLLDAVVGRSGTAYKTWLKSPTRRVHRRHRAGRAWIRSAATRTRSMTSCPTRSPSSTPSTWSGSATQVVDEVRRRVQQDTLGHRGHKDDPLYQIRGLLRHGVEHLIRQPAGQAQPLPRRRRPDTTRSTWPGSATNSSAPSTTPAAAEGRRIASKVIDSFPTCPIPEVARLGRTLKAWRQQVLAYFDTSGVSNGGTEAINLIIEKIRRLAHGFRDFDHYRLRILLAASGNRAYRG